MRCAGKFSFLYAICLTALVTLGTAGASVAVAQTPVTLYNFTVATDVSNPNAPGSMPQGRDGSLYSATKGGGTFGQGGVFAITPTGHETVPFSFPISGVDGNGCGAGVTLGTDGNFYGSCNSGGAHGSGLLYKVTPGGVFTAL